LGKKWGYLVPTGEIQIPFSFALCLQFKERLAPVQQQITMTDEKTGKKLKKLRMGFVDTLGSIAIPIRFNDASCFYNGLAMVHIDKKMGYIDRLGNDIWMEP
jgi:hypothetical protein